MKQCRTKKPLVKNQGLFSFLLGVEEGGVGIKAINPMMSLIGMDNSEFNPLR